MKRIDYIYSLHSFLLFSRCILSSISWSISSWLFLLWFFFYWLLLFRFLFLWLLWFGISLGGFLSGLCWLRFFFWSFLLRWFSWLLIFLFFNNWFRLFLWSLLHWSWLSWGRLLDSSDRLCSHDCLWWWLIKVLPSLVHSSSLHRLAHATCLKVANILSLINRLRGESASLSNHWVVWPVTRHAF